MQASCRRTRTAQDLEARGAELPARSCAISAAAGDEVDASAFLCDSRAASLMFSTPPSVWAAPVCSSLQHRSAAAFVAHS